MRLSSPPRRELASWPVNLSCGMRVTWARTLPVGTPRHAPGLHCTNNIYLHYYRLYQLYRYELTNRLFVYDILLYAVGLWWIICMLLEIIRVINAVEMHG